LRFISCEVSNYEFWTVSLAKPKPFCVLGQIIKDLSDLSHSNSIHILIASSQGDFLLDFNQHCYLPSSQPWWSNSPIKCARNAVHRWFCHFLDQSATLPWPNSALSPSFFSFYPRKSLTIAFPMPVVNITCPCHGRTWVLRR
jgi:hypothetical protein